VTSPEVAPEIVGSVPVMLRITWVFFDTH